MDQLTRDMALFAKGVIESEERTEEEVSGMLNEFADKFADALVELTGTIDSIEKIEAADKLEDTIEESGYADAKTALANLGLIK
jgi:hypothetical protein